jgi:hypothetical protein
MGNWTRIAFSALVSGILTVIAYLLPFTLMLYFFAPGFWLGDALPTSLVNTLSGYLFPVFASFLIWTFLIFGIWWLLARSRSRR